MSKTEQNNTHIDELYLLRGLAILGVIMVHSTSFATVELVETSLFYPLYNFLNRFFAFGTATFIFLSAFVLFYSYYHRPLDKKLIKSFYLNRLKFVFLPYLIFSVFYYFIAGFPFQQLNSSAGFAGVVSDFLKKLATGKAYDHLYFIFVNFQFYLLFPFILWVFQKNKKLVKHGLWAGFLLQWAFVFLNNRYLHIAVGTGSIAFSYLSNYLLGACVGIYYQQFRAWLKGWKTYLLGSLWLFFGCAYVRIYYLLRVCNVYYDAKLYTLLWNLYTYSAALILFLLSFWLYKRLPRQLNSKLVHLGYCSFGIYLFHPFVLWFYRMVDFSFSTWAYHISVFGGFACTLFISWFVVGLINKHLPYAWAIVGKGPKHRPEEKYSKARGI